MLIPWRKPISDMRDLMEMYLKGQGLEIQASLEAVPFIIHIGTKFDIVMSLGKKADALIQDVKEGKSPIALGQTPEDLAEGTKRITGALLEVNTLVIQLCKDPTLWETYINKPYQAVYLLPSKKDDDENKVLMARLENMEFPVKIIPPGPATIQGRAILRCMTVQSVGVCGRCGNPKEVQLTNGLCDRCRARALKKGLRR
jgi:hypothetical protein